MSPNNVEVKGNVQPLVLDACLKIAGHSGGGLGASASQEVDNDREYDHKACCLVARFGEDDQPVVKPGGKSVVLRASLVVVVTKGVIWMPKA